MSACVTKNNRWKKLNFLVEPNLAYTKSSQAILTRKRICSHRVTDILQHSSRGSCLITQESTKTILKCSHILQKQEHSLYKKTINMAMWNELSTLHFRIHETNSNLFWWYAMVCSNDSFLGGEELHSWGWMKNNPYWQALIKYFFMECKLLHSVHQYFPINKTCCYQH